MRASAKGQKGIFDVPAIMEAAAINEFGPPSAVRTQRVPVPEPKDTQVLIEVHAAGVGVWDSLMREGLWQPNGYSTPPIVLGTDGAGVVVKVGDLVTSFSMGDRVYAYGFGGFYAEYVAVEASRVGRIPDHLNFLEAAAASVTGLTTLQGLDDVLRLVPGEKLLIMGASGAMGTLAVQFAKHRGASVIGSASGKEAQRLVHDLGADSVFDARHEDGLKQLKEIASSGLDAAFVLGSSEALEECL
jgi:NADPH2:quinone reductase